MAVSISVCVQGLDVDLLENKVSWYVCGNSTLFYVFSVTSKWLHLDRSSYPNLSPFVKQKKHSIKGKLL